MFCRMFAGDNTAVADTDIVVAVDANMFVMTPEIIRPLLSSPDKVAWVINWSTENYTENWRYFEMTFNMNLLAMRAADWRKVTGYQGSIEGLLIQYRSALSFPLFQIILSLQLFLYGFHARKVPSY